MTADLAACVRRQSRPLIPTTQENDNMQVINEATLEILGPPFNYESALKKVQAAQDLWNASNFGNSTTKA